MTGRVQTLRSNIAGNRPPGGHQPGELYVNWADSQIGVVNSTGANQDFVAVRFFSTSATYAIGDFVIQGGQLYRAIAASSIGAFTPANWSLIGGSVGLGDTPPANPQSGTLWWDSVGGQLYVWYTDPNTSQWVAATNVPGATPSNVAPPMDGIAAVGASGAYARGDHVHPTDTSRYAASNPANYQTDVQVNAVAANYLPLTGGNLSGNFSAPAVTAGVSGLYINNGGGLNIQSAGSGHANLITTYQFNTGVPMWQIQMGDTSGGNMNFYAYNDSGNFAAAPLVLNRATGGVTICPNASSSTNQPFTVGVRNGGVTIGSGDGISFTNNGMIVENSLSAGFVMTVNRRTGNGTSIALYQNNVSCGSITVANNNATAYNTTSDVRLKTDEKSFDAGPILDQINVYNFEWTKAPGVRAYGVFAQEAQAVFPDAITYTEHDDFWGVDYSKFVPLLLQEIKDLRARVQTLEARP